VTDSPYVVVDASLWVARLVPQDTFHKASKNWMESMASQATVLLSPTLLLAEVAGAITRRTALPELALRAVEALQLLPDLRLVEMDQSLVQQAAQLAARHALRSADALYVAVAAQLGIPLVTLDADQRARAGNLVTILPIEDQ